jgi:hypothetical protein
LIKFSPTLSGQTFTMDEKDLKFVGTYNGHFVVHGRQLPADGVPHLT